jgi:hypothetical protein
VVISLSKYNINLNSKYIYMYLMLIKKNLGCIIIVYLLMVGLV